MKIFIEDLGSVKLNKMDSDLSKIVNRSVMVGDESYYVRLIIVN